MTKSNLIEVISEKTEIPKDVVSQVIKEMNDIIIRTLAKGDSVKITGFGTFHTAVRKARNIKNPKTGKILEVPERKVSKFRPGKVLKDSI
jgi:DNA-binding protein HU-beta